MKAFWDLFMNDEQYFTDAIGATLVTVLIIVVVVYLIKTEG